MNIKGIKKATSAVCFIFGLATTSVFAATCPTDLTQDHKGYWQSHEKPGWKSFRATPHGVKVEVKNFAGAVYSQKHKRLACVYRASDGKFIALVSNKQARIQIVDAAWQHDKKHGDYACGHPKVKHIGGCKFNLK